MNQQSFNRYERARLTVVLVIHALTVASLWGEWRRVIVFVARQFLERVPNARFDKPVDHRWLRTFVAERVERSAAA